MEEIKGTSASPRNELHAPLVGQRDFVRERLMLDLERAQQALVAAEQSVNQITKQVRVGVATRAAELQAEAEVARPRAHAVLAEHTGASPALSQRRHQC